MTPGAQNENSYVPDGNVLDRLRQGLDLDADSTPEAVALAYERSLGASKSTRWEDRDSGGPWEYLPVGVDEKAFEEWALATAEQAKRDSDLPMAA